jgi:hypothetical protein
LFLANATTVGLTLGRKAAQSASRESRPFSQRGMIPLLHSARGGDVFCNFGPAQNGPFPGLNIYLIMPESYKVPTCFFRRFSRGWCEELIREKELSRQHS